MLTPQQGHILVRLARQQIEQHLEMQPQQAVTVEELAQPIFAEKRGVFVTLNKERQLRGCIGNLIAAHQLAEGVRHNALNAAFHDHRFRPVTADEVAALHVEISILTEPKALPYRNPEELLHLLRPGVDGVILNAATGSNATFLPQVWQQLPTHELFLAHLCRKAGWTENAWRSGTVQVFTYQVQSFEEPHPLEKTL
jgi:AmmeMemoRadiSam system protein A